MTSSSGFSNPGLSALVSVVVCAKNRAVSIAACLASVQLNRPLEVIVVDGASTDATALLAAQNGAQVISDEGRGLAAARQLGAESAHGRYVAYVDSDVVLTEGCLANLVGILEAEPTVAAVHAQIKSPEVGSYWAKGTQARIDLVDQYAPGEMTSLGCMAVVIRRQLILRYPFDTFFVGACEDEDLYHRLKQAGWKLRCGDAIAYHRHREKLVDLVKQRIWYGRGAARLAIKGHPRARLGLLVHPVKLLGVVFIWRAFRAKRLSLLPYILVQSGSQYVGEALELGSFAAEKLGLRSSSPQSPAQSAASKAL